MNRRHFIVAGAAGAALSAVGLASCSKKENTKTDSDILVVGGSPAGIMAAIAAARLGSSVILAEYHNHIGGLSTSGLGKSDIENKDAIAGLFKEFTNNILKHYIDTYGKDSENVIKCKQGYYYEPSVAEKVFNRMLAAEKNISLRLNHQIEKVATKDNEISAIIFKNRSDGKTLNLTAHAYIDATYEGDVYGLAGAAYRIGRESKEEFNEAHAGRIFFDYNENTFLPGSTGTGDKKIPAYTYRLCLTDNPDNSFILKQPPAGYDRNNYLKYFDDLQEGRLSGPKVFKEGHGYYKAHFNTMMRVFSFAEIPNGKYDVNTNPRPLGFPFAGENTQYAEVGWADREQVFKKHRALALGLLYFVQNDPEVPEEHRKMANQYHLALDEFKDNDHFPWQLYVREARRLKGVYTLNENDVTLKQGAERTTIFDDSIIAGEFPIDSFPASKEPSPDKKVLEGYIGMLPISAYQIPLRTLIPEKLNKLIVPVAASTTHAAYSTIRMEPLWMGIGQAAGTAAALSLQKKVSLREVDALPVQKALLENGQILTYFDDLDITDKAFAAAQFWGTKGFFNSYKAGLREPINGTDLKQWITIFNKIETDEKKKVQPGSEEQVSIKDFLKLLNPATNQSINEQNGFYSTRSGDKALLRGEVCMVLYKRLMNEAAG